MKVKDVMHQGATCVQPTTRVKEIAKRMRDNDIGVVPVCANDRLVGIITDRDITCRAAAATGNRGNMTAQEVMTKPAVCCSPEDYIGRAIELMEAKRVRQLPVTASQKTVVGILSLGDISQKLKIQLSGKVLQAVSAHHL